MEPSYVYIALGIILLLAGRKLYWLTIGVLGFLAGMFFAMRFIPAHPAWMTYVIGAGSGILGAIAAVVIQRIAIAALGFLAGGFLLANVFEEFHWMQHDAFLFPFLVGGVIGALILFYVFEWALIVSSSIGGGFLVARELHVSPPNQIIAIAGLAVIGVLIQASMRKKKSGKGPAKRAPKEKKEESE